MRSDSHRWTPPSPLSRVGDGVTVTEVDIAAQWLVSGVGVLDRFKDQLITWPDRIASNAYALCMRRDRILLVGEPDLLPGFQDGLAVTDVTDAFTIVDLTGPAAFDVLRTGAEIRLDQPSQSVVRRVFGVDVMLCRCEKDRFRLHVPRGLSQAVVEMLV